MNMDICTSIKLDNAKLIDVQLFDVTIDNAHFENGRLVSAGLITAKLLDVKLLSASSSTTHLEENKPITPKEPEQEQVQALVKVSEGGNKKKHIDEKKHSIRYYNSAKIDEMKLAETVFSLNKNVKFNKEKYLKPNMVVWSRLHRMGKNTNVFWPSTIFELKKLGKDTIISVRFYEHNEERMFGNIFKKGLADVELFYGDREKHFDLKKIGHKYKRSEFITSYSKALKNFVKDIRDSKSFVDEASRGREGIKKEEASSCFQTENTNDKNESTKVEDEIIVLKVKPGKKESLSRKTRAQSRRKSEHYK